MKRHILTALQIFITIGLLCWIFRNPEENRKLLAALRVANTWWLLPGLAALAAGLLLQTKRWLILLEVQGIAISYWRGLRIILVGMFFNLFLLGSTGGDIIKIFLIMREAPEKKAGALLSVFIDRVVGVLALAAVSAVVILLRWQELMTHEVTRYLVFTVAVILGGSLGFIFLAWLTGRLDWAAKLPQWLPAREKIAEAAGAFVEYARAGGSVGTAFLLSIPAHLLMFSTFWFGGRAFSAGLNLLSVYCVMPIVATVTALPISVGGAGLREGLFIKILGALYQTPESIATLVSLSGFMMQVFWSLVGGAVYLAYRSTDHASLSEMKESVDELEKRVEHNIEAGRPPEA
ncbi:MAG: lysylphosphatidylglycerol synthase transmembrane domain-containing protein [bacterium]